MATERRKFLHMALVAGAFLPAAPLIPEQTAPDSRIGNAPASHFTETVSLNGPWRFKTDPGDTGLAAKWFAADFPLRDGEAVAVPHTWQTSEKYEEYRGAAWYARSLSIPRDWADSEVRLEFEAVFHSARVWLNGQQIGEHIGKGYTAFALDLTGRLRYGGENTLVVRVNNEFDKSMLPRGKSYDWTNDGGITRPVSLLVSPRTFIERVDVDSMPDLSRKNARLDIRCALRNTGTVSCTLHLTIRVMEENSGRTVLSSTMPASVRLAAGGKTLAQFPALTLDNPLLWHFDHPSLYTLIVDMQVESRTIHSFRTTFGVRKIEIRDCALYLNGERMRLMGVERTDGSNPDCGMAESGELIKRDHNDLKELNCVFTRVHWQHDRRVLDYCDRHGILIQEEVPAWGGDTFSDMTVDPAPEIMRNGLEQLREMIDRDRNHPSIFSWGLSNEINGQNPPAYAFVRRMYEEAHKLDPNRLCAYPSNSLESGIEKDVAGLMDFIAWNEYYESWYEGGLEDIRKNLKEIHRVFPDKMVVISEYGYCECTPDRIGGDPRRIEILRNHTNIYREFDFVCGAIFFCYNDYRTHVGDKGKGALKQRVHGVVDLYGARKPSYEVLRAESSPIERMAVVKKDGGILEVTIETRKTLPAYTLRDYTIKWIVYNSQDLPMERGTLPVPELRPGDRFTGKFTPTTENPARISVNVVRPTGFSAASAEYRGK